MSGPANSEDSSVRRRAWAWAGGGAAALGAAALTILVQGAPLGRHLWSLLPRFPEQVVGRPWAFAAAFCLGLASVWLGVGVPARNRVFFLLLLAALLTLSQSLVLGLYGIAWEPFPALLAMLGGGAIATMLRPDVVGPDTWFRGRLSSKTLVKLIGSGDASFLRPDQREATVVTCRLLNESALREVLPARDFLKLCQAFRSQASSVLLGHPACLDPTEASGVRALFGLPLTSRDAADEAVTAALALDDAMRVFAETNLTSAGAPACGIGIASGKLTAGLVGQVYTVHGDALELSRWLSAATANYEVRLLTDSATHLAASRVEDRPLEFVNPPEGAAVEIFHLLGTTGSLSQAALARRQAFRDAIMLLRAGHAEDALHRFSDARHGLTLPDPVLEYFVSLATDQTQRDNASTGLTSNTGTGITHSPASDELLKINPALSPEDIVNSAAGLELAPPPPHLGATESGMPRRKNKVRKLPRRP